VANSTEGNGTNSTEGEKQPLTEDILEGIEKLKQKLGDLGAEKTEEPKAEEKTEESKNEEKTEDL
jgi:hypothetical protein